MSCKTGDKHIGHSLERRELPLTVGIGVVAGLLTYYSDHGVPAVVAVEAFVLCMGAAIWVVPRVFAKLEDNAAKLDRIRADQQREHELNERHDRMIRQIETNLSELAASVEVFGGPGSDPTITDAVRAIAQDAKLLPGNPHKLRLLHSDLMAVKDRAQRLANGIPVASKVRCASDQLQWQVERFWRTQPNESTLRSATTFPFWEEIDSPDQLLDFNVDVARTLGGEIARIFLTDKTPEQLTEREWNALEVHRRFTATHSDLLQTRILHVSSQQLVAYGHFAVSCSRYSQLALDLVLTPDRRPQEFVLLSDEEVLRDRLRTFELIYSRATPIARYMKRRPSCQSHPMH